MIFEAEKIKIKIRVRHLFRMPLKYLFAKLPEIPDDFLSECVAIFSQKSGNFPAISRQEFCNLSAAFPAFLTALLPDFSRERVEFLAEMVLQTAEIMRKNNGKLPPDVDDDSQNKPS